MPSAGRASTISPLAWAIASREPNSPMWAVPTLRTAATVGGAISHELGDVADASGAHLEGQEARVGGGTQHGEWDADLVVLVALRPDRPSRRREHLGEEVLGAGLALRAGEGDHGRGQGVEDVAREPPRARTGSSTTTVGAPVGRPAEHAGGARGEGAGDEVVPVDVLADDGDEQPARDGRPGVDEGRCRDDGAGGVVVHLSPDDGRDLGQAQGDHRRSSARATSRSSNGSTSPATSWPVS